MEVYTQHYNTVLVISIVLVLIHLNNTTEIIVLRSGYTCFTRSFLQQLQRNCFIIQLMSFFFSVEYNVRIILFSPPPPPLPQKKKNNYFQ